MIEIQRLRPVELDDDEAHHPKQVGQVNEHDPCRNEPQLALRWTGKCEDEDGEEGKEHEPITRRPDLQESHTVGDANLPAQFGRAHLVQHIAEVAQRPLRMDDHAVNEVLIQQRLVPQEVLIGHIPREVPHEAQTQESNEIAVHSPCAQPRSNSSSSLRRRMPATPTPIPPTIKKPSPPSMGIQGS